MTFILDTICIPIRICIQLGAIKHIRRIRLPRIAAEHHRVERHVHPPQLRRRENRHRGLRHAVVGVLDFHCVVARDRLPVRMRGIGAGGARGGHAQSAEYAVVVGCRPVINGVGITSRAASGHHREGTVAAAEAGHVRVRGRGLRQRHLGDVHLRGADRRAYPVIVINVVWFIRCRTHLRNRHRCGDILRGSSRGGGLLFARVESPGQRVAACLRVGHRGTQRQRLALVLGTSLDHRGRDGHLRTHRDGVTERFTRILYPFAGALGRNRDGGRLDRVARVGSRKRRNIARASGR